jgi:hypothetical protein
VDAASIPETAMFIAVFIPPSTKTTIMDRRHCPPVKRSGQRQETATRIN